MVVKQHTRHFIKIYRVEINRLSLAKTWIMVGGKDEYRSAFFKI